MSNKMIALASIGLMMLIGCGGGGSNNPVSPTGTTDQRQPTVDVKYTLNGTKRPTCHDADEIGELNPDNDDFVWCIWFCGRYNGVEGRNGTTVAVDLMFRKSERTDEGIWELTDEGIDEASAIVCKDG